jgi:hypothetical protein
MHGFGLLTKKRGTGHIHWMANGILFQSSGTLTIKIDRRKPSIRLPEPPNIRPHSHALQDTGTDQVADDPAEVDICSHDTTQSERADLGGVQ